MSTDSIPHKMVILIPVYDDWDSLNSLIPEIDKNVSTPDCSVDILVCDDGSNQSVSAFRPEGLKHIQKIEVLSLRRNQGHQRAIAIGLSFLEANRAYDCVIVMDGDGEDKPSDLVRLFNEWKLNPTSIFFAERAHRTENLRFRIFYRLYRRLFYLLTNRTVQEGNFSLLPWKRLRQLVVVSEIWNNYSAGIKKSRIPYQYVRCDRGKRLKGESKLNFYGLVLHGFSSISVFSDVIGIKALIVTAILAVFILVLGLATVSVRIFTSIAIPGWATYTLGILVVAFLQLGMLSLTFALLINNSRNQTNTIPTRDYPFYIDQVIEVFNHGSND